MKNITSFVTELPVSDHFADLIIKAEHLDDEGEAKNSLYCSPCGENSISSFGFDPIHSIINSDSGYCLRFKFEEKVISSKLITQLFNKKVAEIQREEPNFKPKKKESCEMKESILHSLIPTTPAIESYVCAHYHAKSGYLILDTSKETHVARIINFLRSILGSLKTTTLHVDGITNSLTENILSSIKNEDGLGFDGFSFGNSIGLIDPLDKYRKATLTGDYELNTLLELIQDGYQVTKTRLERDGLSFTFSSDLKISSISLSTTIKEQIEEDIIAEYGESALDMEAIAKQKEFDEEQTQVELLVAIQQDLVEFFSKLIAE